MNDQKIVLVSVLDLDNSVHFSRDTHEGTRKHSRVCLLPEGRTKLRSTPYSAQPNRLLIVSLFTMSITSDYSDDVCRTDVQTFSECLKMCSTVPVRVLVEPRRIELLTS